MKEYECSECGAPMDGYHPAAMCYERQIARLKDELDTVRREFDAVVGERDHYREHATNLNEIRHAVNADLAMAQAEVLRLKYDLEQADKALEQARAELDDKDNSLNIHFEDRMRAAALAHDAALADLRERAANVAEANVCPSIDVCEHISCAAEVRIAAAIRALGLESGERPEGRDGVHRASGEYIAKRFREAERARDTAESRLAEASISAGGIAMLRAERDALRADYEQLLAETEAKPATNRPLTGAEISSLTVTLTRAQAEQVQYVLGWAHEHMQRSHSWACDEDGDVPNSSHAHVELDRAIDTVRAALGGE